MRIDPIDLSILELIQGDLPLESQPFAGLSQQLGISEGEIVERIEKMREKGAIRRWGAVLRHQQAGFIANAMVAWKVEPDKAEQAGRHMAGFREVSHCYLRQVPATFPYNLFTMIHARSDAQLRESIARAATETGLEDYLIIRSLKEFKKASMKYV
ncbi:MAG: AsnC family transcriptional regulator [Syntrophomonadaceae bacterium]